MGLAVAVPAVGEDGDVSAGGITYGPPPPSREPTPLPEAVRESLNSRVSDELAQLEQRAQWLEGDEAVEERTSSATAYEGMGREEAETLLESQFDHVLAGLDGDPGRVVSGLEVQEVLAPTVVRVGDHEEGEGTEIIESTIPLADAVLGGQSKPVDLGLRRDGDRYFARNPLVDIQLPASPQENVVVGDLTISGLPGDGEAQASLRGETDLFYPETAPDTDTVVAPLSAGIEVLNQLRSLKSPEEMRFELALADGTELVGDGEGGARVIDAGGTRARIPAPSAVDAQGAEVPVAMRIEDSTLVLDVAHRGMDVSYPILLDPQFLNEELPWSWQYWGYVHEGGGNGYEHWINGSNIHVNSLGNNVFHAAGSNGHYYFSPPGTTSYVSGASFGPVTFEVYNCYTAQPHGFIGIANTNGTWANLGTWSTWSSWMPGYSTGWSGSPGSRWAVVGVGTTVNSQLSCRHSLDVAGATVTMDDNDAPSIGTPGAPSQKVGQYNVAISTPVSDPGLGLSWVKMSAPEAGGGTKTWTAYPSGREDCGYWSRTCPQSWSGPITLEPKYLPEGQVTVTLSAKDAVDNHASPRSFIVTVDHTPPVTTISSGPATGTAVAASPTYTFQANEAGSTFECRIVGKTTFAPCSGSGYTAPSLSPGRYHFEVRGKDPVGNQNSNATSREFFIGPPNTLIDSGPGSPTNDETPDFEYHAEYSGFGAMAAFECRVDGDQFAPCSPDGFITGPLDNGPHAVQIRAVKDGLVDPTPAQQTFTVDLLPPPIDIVSGPTGPTNENDPTFTFTKEAGASVECSIDKGQSDYGACAGQTSDSPAAPLPEETYFFRVTATDVAGNEAKAQRAFIVDTTPPQTVIDSGPRGLTSDPLPRFSFDSNEKEREFNCRIDAEGVRSCGSEEQVVEELGEGQHTIYASAVDEAGNADPSPAARTFSIDSTLPAVTIEGGPSGVTPDTTPTFTFSTEQGADVECSLAPAGTETEPSDFRACTTPTSDTPANALADGRYGFELLVTDAAGNERITGRHFTVDTAPPDTLISFGPDGPTDEVRPIFIFGSTESRASFECRIDADPFGPCSGPGPLHFPEASLADGDHTFTVRAVDAAGAADPSPAVREFAVDTQKPQTTIESGPNGPTLDSTPAFGYSASEPASFQCKVDDGSFSSCPQASVELAGVPDGQHTVAVRALDEALNPDPTPAKRTFVVDTTDPDDPEATGDIREPGVPGVQLDVGIRDGSAASPATRQAGVESISVSIDGNVVYSDEMPCAGAFHTCPDKVSRNLELPYQNVIGNHVYRVKGADALGHPAEPEEWLHHTVAEGTLIANSSGAGSPGCGSEPATAKEVIADKPNQMLRGGPGNDLIIVHENQSWVKTIKGGPGCDIIIGGYAQETIRGETGADLIRGNRSNDTILGGEGADEIFGGIGDDHLHGNQGNDYLDGGPGADEVRGESDDDNLRGGQGIDALAGGDAGTDTAVFADAVTPGFARPGGEFTFITAAVDENLYAVANFPGAPQRGVFVNLNGAENGGGDHRKRNYAFDGFGPNGGGLDYLYIPQGKSFPGVAKVETSGDFEKIVGSAFADLIRGSGQAETILTGPGPDIVRGGGGADKISGGTEGDFIDGSGTAAFLSGGEGKADENRCVSPGAANVQNCSSGGDAVVPRSAGTLGVGIQAPEAADDTSNPFRDTHANVFVDGTSGRDMVEVSYPNRNQVVFEVKVNANVKANGCSVQPAGNPPHFPPRTVTCNLEGLDLGSVVLYGGAGDDQLASKNLPRKLPGSIALLGGEGTDRLIGNDSDELLHDGTGQAVGIEEVTAGDGDDVLFQGDGRDTSVGGPGNDLLISSEICSNDKIFGDGESGGNIGRDNAQFHPEKRVGVYANLFTDKLGEVGQPDRKCQNGSYDPLRHIDDLEGSPKGDFFEGDNHDNLLLGRGGADVLKGNGGNDLLNARDNARDNVINCGGDDGDRAHIDRAKGLPAALRDNEQQAKATCPKKVDGGGALYTLREDLIEGLMEDGASTAGVKSAALAVAPVGAYPLDESSGSLAENVIEEAEDGEYRHASAFGDSEGPILQAEGSLLTAPEDAGVELDGTNDYIELGEGPEAAEESELPEEPEAEEEVGISVELWVKFDEAPSEKEYLYSGMDEGEGPYLYRAADGKVVFGVHTETGNPEVSTYEAIEDGQWHQVVGTLEGEEIALYVDGFPHRMGYGQPVLPEDFAEEETSEEHEEVIGSSTGMSHFLDGTVDSVVVYDGAIEAGEVIEDLAASKAEEPEIMLAPEPETQDADGDSVTDGVDNCPALSNPEQVDEDLNGSGDECLPPDSDGDEVPDDEDLCVEIYDPLQIDNDGDGLGVECDPSEPALSTEPATSVTSTTANLNAMIDAEGYETTYSFEYGTTTAYGSSAPATPQPLGETLDQTVVSQQLSGLEPGTTYHYRVVASSEGGESVEGASQTFTTKAAPDIPAKLSAMTVVEPFDGSAESLERFGSSWTTLGWAGGGTPKGSVTTSGWRPVDAFSTVNGASYNPPLEDAGWGTGASMTLTANPGIAERYFSLWIDMAYPMFIRHGYELRFTNVGTDTYDVALARWNFGARTELASKTGVSFANGNSLALVDLGGTVSAWTDTGSGYAQLLSAADATFAGGKAGIEGSGNISRLSGFRISTLEPTPEAITKAATEASGSTATLNGTVNPEGLPTTYSFEYGTTTAYGSSAPATPADAGSGTADVPVSQQLSGLGPGTTYHYRLVATSEAGTSYGEDVAVTTLRAPVAESDVASEVEATQATLNGTVNPEGLPTTYRFEYGTTTAYGSSAPATPQPIGSGEDAVGVERTLTNLSPGTTYHYRVVAESEAGVTYGEDRTLQAKTLDIPAKLSAMTVVEPFDGSAESLERFGSSWTTLGWAGGGTPKGSVTTSGWRPVDAFSTVNGASYNPPLEDAGWGTGASMTLTANPGIAERYFSLWIDMAYPMFIRHGYELRFTNVGTDTYDVALARWNFGARTELASKTGVSFANGNSLALVDLGGTVSAWTDTGSGYAQLLSAADATFAGGKAGIEGSGNISRLSGFRISTLEPTPEAITKAATEASGSTATLNGTVNPEGLPTTYSFEYGTTTAYGSSAPATPADAGSGTADVPVSQQLSGLQPGTTYHYRLVATNEAGTSYGEDIAVTPSAKASHLSSFGSYGTGSGQFSHPAGIAVDSSGNIWVVDQDNDRVQKFTGTGEFLTSFGSSGSGAGQFGRPTDVAIDAQGNLFVTDAGNSRIEKFSPSGEFISQFGSYGTGNGQFRNAESVAIDPSGRIWVGDTYNGRLQKFSASGEYLATVGSYGSGQGQMIEPTGIDIGPGGDVWVADWGNQRVTVFSESGGFIRQFGSPGSGDGQFARPDVIEVDSQGNVWVGDQNNDRIQQFNLNGEYVAQFGTAGSGEGQFNFGWPMGIASDGSGNLWISDTGNHRVQRWK